MDCVTSWGSFYGMICRLLDCYQAVFKTLYDTDDKHLLLKDTEITDPGQLRKLPKPFDKATTLLSAEIKTYSHPPLASN